MLGRLRNASHAGLFLAAAVLCTSQAHAARPVCGDDFAQGPEDCDGTDLRGETCQSLGFGGGTLACDANCDFDTSGCTPGGGGGAECGDNLVEDFEECDGTSDAACPGQCSAHCACPGAAPGGLEVHMIDVGQGEGVLVISPDGFTMLFDAGVDSEASTVNSYLTAVGVTNLDYTVASHMHADHIGAVDGVLAAHPEVVVSFDHGGTYTTNQYDEYDAATGSRRTTVNPSDTIDLGSSMSAVVLHAHEGASNENNNSVVLKLTYGDQTVLLGGDCEGVCEATFDPGPTQIYQVHHHGSSDSSTDELLTQMGAYTAMIPVGTNSFGHPHQQTLDRLAAHQVAVYRTDLDGDIVVLSDGTAYTVNGDPVCSGTDTRTCGTSDVGACQLGSQSCVSNMWGSCQGAVEPVPEDCNNGVDDDCDGFTDGEDPDCGGTGSGGVVIAQVGYDTPGTDAEEEFVDLYNGTGTSQSLDGWSLSDNVDTWALPTGHTIAPGEYISIARDAAGFEALYGIAPDVTGMPLALANAGDELSLSDASGEVDYCAWENYAPGWSITANTGASIERTDPTVDTDTVNDWSVTDPASPRGGQPAQCGNGTCDGGEDCTTCAADCPGVTTGPPQNRWCCGDATCDMEFEDAMICPVDCAP